MSTLLRLTRYTYPEQLSSRESLQVTPTADAHPSSTPTFTRWTELHPSRRLPAYAIRSILEIGQELIQAPSRQIAQTLSCEIDPTQGLSQLVERGLYAPQDLVFASPLIVEEAVVGESLSETLRLAKSRGWSELPVPVAMGVLISAGRALAHLHSLGFSHGAISSDTLTIRYAGAEDTPRVSRLNQREGALLTGWIRGNLFQLTPEAEVYGRGPSADCRALLWTLLELIGGAPSVRDESGLRIPTSMTHGSGPMSPESEAALSLLPQGFAAWVRETIQTPPPHMGAMLSQLQRVLDPSQPAFNGPGLSRWLSRLAPERVLQWERALEGQDPQSLQLLSASGGVLTTHAVSATSGELGQGEVAGSTTSALSNSTNTKSQAADRRTADSSAASDEGVSSSAKKKSAKKKSAPESNKSRWERYDDQLNAFESRVGAALDRKKSAQDRFRVAVIWRDTVTEVKEFPANKVVTLGSDPSASLYAPSSLLNAPLNALMTPAGEGEVVVHVPADAQGWGMTSADASKRAWRELSGAPAGDLSGQAGGEALPVTLSRGGMGAIIRGDVAVFFQLYRPQTKESSFTLPIPTQSLGLIWCFGIAVLAHLAILIPAYGGRDFSPQTARLEQAAARFVELNSQLEDIESKLPELEEPDLIEQEPTEYQEEEASPYDSYDMPDSPKIEDRVEDLARERFGEGKEKAENLADFLTGDLKSSGSLALGDVSADLGATSDSGLSLGSAFGNLGGTVTTEGGGGRINTSGGLKGAKRAGSLKARRVSRKVRGRVKPLKSRVRLTGGSLSKAEVFKVISKHQAKISACYERELMKSPNLSGKLTVSWLIKPNGRVSNVKQVLSSIKSAPLKKCIFKVIKKMRFPKPKGGSVKIKYPFVLQQG